MKRIVLITICAFLSISAYSQDIASLKAEIESLKTRVEALESIVKGRVDSTKITNDVIQKKQCIATTVAGNQCSRIADDGSDYCWQHKKTYETTSSSTASNSSTLNSSSNNTRVLQTGPRGGQYYINSKGKKVYVKKK